MSGYDFGIVTGCLVGAASLLSLREEEKKKKMRGRTRERKRKRGAICSRLRGISIIFESFVTAKSEFGVNF